jgi:hypothetical protein
VQTNGTWVTPNERETKNAVSRTRYTTDFGHLRGGVVLVSRFCKSGVDSCAPVPDTASTGCFGWSWSAMSCVLTLRKIGKVHRVMSQEHGTGDEARLKERLACEGEKDESSTK